MRKYTGRIRSVILCLLAVFITVFAGISGSIVMADTEKTTVTREMLAGYYKAHYTADRTVSTVALAATGVFFLIILGIFIYKIVELKRATMLNKIATIMQFVVLVPMLGTTILIFALFAFGMATDPDPETAVYSLRLETVLRTEEESSTDSEGTTTYSYYAWIVDERRESGERRMFITEDMYNTITEPGEYYFGVASHKRTHKIFSIYPASQYEPAQDVPVE